MNKPAFANGVWFKAKPAGINSYDDDDDDCDKTVMCKGCVFDKMGAAACTAAGLAAAGAGLPDCESGILNPGHVYVRDRAATRRAARAP